MDKQSTDAENAFEASAPQFAAADYLARTLPRKPGDLLKIIPMPGRQAFRVNWYANRASGPTAIPALTVQYIRESKFLFCRLNAKGVPEITYPARQ